MNLSEISIHKILFIDIETVPEFGSWKEVDENTQKLWAKKTERLRGEEISAETYYEDRAGIWAEFGKIVCISVGLVVENQLRVKSFTGEETQILNDFNSLLKSDYFRNGFLFCAHNGKEFDYPYLARRMVIQQIPMPNALENYGKKPWEVPHLDTLELWKFGDYKHYTSLELLANILGIPTPKGEMDGSQVKEVYYQDQDIEKIVRYCEGDVLTTANILRKLRYEPLLERE